MSGPALIFGKQLSPTEYEALRAAVRKALAEPAFWQRLTVLPEPPREFAAIELVEEWD